MTTDLYWRDLERELSSETELEEKLDILRRFRKTREEAIRLRDLAGQIPLLSLLEELSALAEAVLRGGYETALSSLGIGGGPFAVVSMGKFGGRELTYRSDLDIIYLFERENDQELYTRLGQRIISALTLVTREGFAYKIDAALRPSGNAGTLVSTLDSFQRYHEEMGQTWERQALIKARPVLGDPPFLNRIAGVLEDICYRSYDPRKTAREIHRLRMRMEKELARERPGRYNLKTGRGGIVDIEFAVQYLQLVHGRKNPSIRTPNTVLGLEALEKAGMLEGGVAGRLKEAYLFYREIETRLRLILEHPTDELVEGSEGIERLEADFLVGRPVLGEYLKIREAVRSLYEKVMSV